MAEEKTECVAVHMPISLIEEIDKLKDKLKLSKNALFVECAVRNYITRGAVEEIGLKTERLKDAFEVGLGGKLRKIKECCVVQGNIKKNNPFNFIS
jgi:hypothetical protein